MSSFEKTYQKAMAQIGKEIDAFPWENRHAYAQWLAQTYYFANTTTRLLALASAYTDYDRYALHNRFLDHAKEERGHEKMLINDLKAIDMKLENFPENYPAAGLYQSQYYWIQQHTPLAFFGYIIMLEGVGALHCGRAYQRVVKAFGEKAGVFLKVHSQDDVDHIEKAMKQILEMPKSVEPFILRNFEHSTNFYLKLLVEAKADANTGFRAA
jgi:hypothetical protein